MVLIRLFDGLNEIVGRVVAFVAVIFALMIIYDVVLRYGFNAPTLWAFDLTKQLYGFYFILLGGYALRHQAHVRVDPAFLRPGFEHLADKGFQLRRHHLSAALSPALFRWISPLV